jgi:glycosyltransferase involved in cell wall biosynthesis
VIRRVKPGTDVSVSAVIPFFNDGAIVEEAVRSIRRQSRPVDEIVVVDDGSTDPFSLSVLARLQDAGIAVVRQQNKGPGSARNLGVTHTGGDALFFLDSDDTVAVDHVERAVAALADAPDDVGFVYPDLQFTGNESRLLVMPPYNLYLLLHRNFCGMGGLVDRAVFDAGFGFRSEQSVGHEDWEFFVRLGLKGIFGRPLHSPPLRYRRWGYSRSDGVHQSGLAVSRQLHPELDVGGRLVEIKRVWAPALSVVVPTSGEHSVADQSCDDFEIVRGEAGVPRTRGRWVLMLEGDGLRALYDGTFIERVIRLASDQSPPAPLALHEGSSGWHRLVEHDARPFGVVAEGHYYLDWSRTAASGVPDIAAFCAYLDVTAGAAVRWAYAHGTPPEALIPLAQFRLPLPPPEPPSGPLETRASEVERGFRHHEALPLFMPATGIGRLPHAPGTSQDGLGAIVDRAWSDWMPPRSLELYLLVDIFGRATLETAASPRAASRRATAAGPARLCVGQLWDLPFPGTACLSSSVDPSTEDIVYKITRELPSDGDDAVLGYVPLDVLPGRVPLRRSVEEWAALVQGPRHVTPPRLTDLSPGVYLEPPRVPSSLEFSTPPASAPPDAAVPREPDHHAGLGFRRRKGQGESGRKL